MDKDKILVLSGRSTIDLIPQLISLLDGTRTIDEIASNIADYDKETVISVINLLRKEGLLEEGASTEQFSKEKANFFSEQTLFFSHFTENKYALQEQLLHTKLCIFGLNPIGSYLTVLLARSGIGTLACVDDEIVKDEDVGIVFSHSDKGKLRSVAIMDKCKEINPDLNFLYYKTNITSVKEISSIIEGCNLVILAANYLFSPLYKLLNQACLNKNIIWTSCTIDNIRGLIGPTIIPRETACYTCYEIRMKSNIINYDEYLIFEQFIRSNPLNRKAYGQLYSFPLIVASLMALETIKILTNIAPPSTYGNVLILDFLTMKMQQHPILKIPRCPDCGLPSTEKRTLKVWMG
jgi:thiazole/oxazole-forming peptide maturase SagC family component